METMQVSNIQGVVGLGFCRQNCRQILVISYLLLPLSLSQVTSFTTPVHTIINNYISWAIAKMTAQCALCMGALKIFGTPWELPWRRDYMPTAILFPKFFMGFCSNWAYKCARKIWIS